MSLELYTGRFFYGWYFWELSFKKYLAENIRGTEIENIKRGKKMKKKKEIVQSSEVQRGRKYTIWEKKR